MMRLPPFDYLPARTVEDAVKHIADHGPDAALVAGGTDLYPSMKRRQAEPKVLVGLHGIRELRGIHGGARTGMAIGAMTVLDDVATHAELGRHYAALAASAGLVASPSVRRMGTIGGNICADTRCSYFDQSLAWRTALGFCLKKGGDACAVAPASARCRAVSSSDTAPALWALGARVRLVGSTGERTLPIAALYRDDGLGHVVKEPGELLTDILLPPADGWRSTYLKLRRRGSFDFPVLGVAVAVRMEGDVTREARIVLGAVASTPREATAAGQALIGERLTPEVIARAAEAAAVIAKPVDNTDFPPLYRKRMAGLFVRRALRKVAGLPEIDESAERVG